MDITPVNGDAVALFSHELHFGSMKVSTANLRLTVRVWKEREPPKLLSVETLLCFDISVKSQHLSPTATTFVQSSICTELLVQDTTLLCSRLSAPLHIVSILAVLCKYFKIRKLPYSTYQRCCPQRSKMVLKFQPHVMSLTETVSHFTLETEV